VYDKHGIQEVGPLGGGGPGGVDDPSAFFAAVFGGERFHDYVRPSHLSPYPIYLFTLFPNLQIGEISLMKEMSSVTEVMLSEEDKEELKAAGGAAGVKGSKDGKPVAGSPSETTPGIPHPEQTSEKKATSPTTQDGPSDHPPQASSSAGSPKEKAKAKTPTTPRPSTDARPTTSSSHLTPFDTPGSGASTPKEMGTKERLEKEHAGTPKRKMKLTPEQKAKIDEIGEERDKAMDARIEELTRKLKEVSVGFVNIYTLLPFLLFFLVLEVYLSNEN
jgi:hypothetical protein